MAKFFAQPFMVLQTFLKSVGECVLQHKKVISAKSISREIGISRDWQSVSLLPHIESYKQFHFWDDDDIREKGVTPMASTSSCYFYNGNPCLTNSPIKKILAHLQDESFGSNKPHWKFIYRCRPRVSFEELIYRVVTHAFNFEQISPKR